jgi:acetylornithine deacetylase/succinyl-diaminopimelate desuccinylase-like protein
MKPTILDKYRSMLNQYLTFRSISTDPAYFPEIKKTVEWLQQQFVQTGFAVKILQSGKTNPVVAARYEAGQAETILIYGHYDVQPADPDQGWKSDPFQLHEADKRLYGRGVVDNKGQALVHIATAFDLIERCQLAYNLVFLIEGNEESGNPDLPELLHQNRNFLKCDHVLISDGEIIGQHPTIEASLRGGANMAVKLKTAKNDLHSGIAGGAVPNAAHELGHLLAALHDSRGAVTVPGFYDDTIRPSTTALEQNMQIADPLDIAENLGVKELRLANAKDFYTQTGLYPTLQVTGLNSGYTGEGFANIVPAQAEARLNLRTVPGQNPQKIASGIENFLLNNIPNWVDIEVKIDNLHDAVTLNINTPLAQRARRTLGEVFRTEVLTGYVGGAIPIVSDLQRILKVDPLLVSLGNDDCNMHGANENFRLDLIEKGLEFSHQFFGRS